LKLLLVRFSSLGDVVLATAAVEALHAERPDARVDVLTKPPFFEVFAGHPGVGECLAWDPSAGLVPLARMIRGRQYDWVVDLHRNLRTTILRALTPGTRWCGYRKGAWRRRLAVWMRRPDLLPKDHVVDRYIAALRPLGITGRKRLPKVYPGEKARRWAGELLRASGWDGSAALIALAPGARWPAKAWPRDSWVELSSRLHYNRPTFPVLLGGAADASLCDSVHSGGEMAGANLAGRTTLLETAAVLAQCAALVTNDSAPLHLATAVGTPVVALFGPTVRAFGFHPLGSRDVVLEEALTCRPCSLHGGNQCPEGHHRCLRGISAVRVADALEKLVGAEVGAHDAGGRGGT